MAVTIALPFSPVRAGTYIRRIPLFTRVVLLLIGLCALLRLQHVFDVVRWGALIPNEVGLMTMHRLNTYVFIHQGFFHMLMNALALTPLLERFEAEHGTLVTVAMFIGPLSTFPAGLYLLVERVILRGNAAVIGASVWVFLLLSAEAVKTSKQHPRFSISGFHIPTWTTPLFFVAVVSMLVSNVSLIGHLCSVAIGYVFGLGYLKVLVPPEKILRLIESKCNLLGRLPNYVSVDQKTFGRYGILPTTGAMSNMGPGHRLG